MTPKIWIGYSCEDVQLLDADWFEFETLASVTFHAESRKKIERVMQSYREHISGYRKAVRPNKIKPLLDEVVQFAEKLSATVQKFHDDEIGAIAERQLRYAAALTFRRQINIFSLGEKIRCLADFSKQAIANLPDDNGRENNDPYLPDLIRALSKILHESGAKGHRSKSGRAFVMSACLKAGADNFHSNEAFDQRIKEAFRGRKPHLK